MLQYTPTEERRAPPQQKRRRPYTNPMPECASQQVCNAVFMRLKFVQPLCRCGGGTMCSTRMHPNDGHTVNLLADKDGTISLQSHGIKFLKYIIQHLCLDMTEDDLPDVSIAKLRKNKEQYHR
ncbi:hypothetical protein JTE90_018524 [Oedothorax gibbosus]|uniref:Uncharacterized protein n=1 Tax=Oedothorax gibbosus TaxID=931172 RepID=A0AAV6UMK4_9ARAC|nr:hypothetical protein JTE90_018524 [Oedothorax gibbosus]